MVRFSDQVGRGMSFLLFRDSPSWLESVVAHPQVLYHFITSPFICSGILPVHYDELPPPSMKSFLVSLSGRRTHTVLIFEGLFSDALCNPR